MHDPIILALESSSSWCSAALIAHGRRQCIAERAGQRHSSLILPMVRELLDQHELRPTDCDAFAFGAGPGSFTGLRIGCGLAQGMGLAAGKPVFAIDSLAAIAWASFAERGPAERARRSMAVVIDARMGEVYAGRYRLGGEPLGEPAPPLQVELAPMVGLLDAAGAALLAAADEPPLLAIDPAIPSPISGAFGGWAAMTRLPGPAVARAAAVAELALARWRAGERPEAAAAAPLYVRNQVALDVDAQAELRRQRAERLAAVRS